MIRVQRQVCLKAEINPSHRGQTPSNYNRSGFKSNISRRSMVKAMSKFSRTQTIVHLLKVKIKSNNPSSKRPLNIGKSFVIETKEGNSRVKYANGVSSSTGPPSVMVPKLPRLVTSALATGITTRSIILHRSFTTLISELIILIVKIRLNGRITLIKQLVNEERWGDTCTSSSPRTIWGP